MGIGQEFVGQEQLRMSLVGVEGQRQRRAFQDDSHSRMAMAVDAALVALGLPKPPFQLKVVLGKIWIVSADKEAGSEAVNMTLEDEKPDPKTKAKAKREVKKLKESKPGKQQPAFMED